MNDFHVFSTVDSGPQNMNELNNQITVSDMYHKSCTDYYQIIDCIVINLKKRFSSESLEMASSIDSFHKLNYEQSKYFIEHYKVNILLLKIEFIFVKFR